MKSKLMLSFPCWIAAQALLLGLVCLTSGSANAQNLLKNPDFEQPLGPDNWTIVYAGIANPITLAWPTTCGPNDFEVKGRTRHGHKDKAPGTWDGEDGTGLHYWNKFGGHFRAGHDWLMHAYFRQVVTGLVPGTSYTISCRMALFEGVQYKVQIYLEALGGPGGTSSQCYPSAATLADPGESGYLTNSIWNNPNNWALCIVTNTASNLGQIEVRLHYNKRGSTGAEKWRNLDAFYDHAAVMPTGAQPTPPDFKIVSFTQSNQDLTLEWETVMNNRYRIQVSSDLSDPYSWKTFLGPYTPGYIDPWQDPDFLATGTNMTFTTNVALNHLSNPNYALGVPLFFRVLSQSFQP